MFESLDRAVDVPELLKDGAQVSVVFVKFRIQPDRRAERFNRQLQLSLSRKRKPKCIMCIRESRLECDCGLELCDGAISLFFQKREALIVVRLSSGCASLRINCRNQKRDD